MAESSPRTVSLAGSERKRASSSQLIEPLSEAETLSVGLVLRLPLGAPPLPSLAYRGKSESNRRNYLSREEYADVYSAASSDLETVTNFVQEHGLSVTETSSVTRNVTVKGTARQFQLAFSIQLNRYKSPLPQPKAHQNHSHHAHSHGHHGHHSNSHHAVDDESPSIHVHRGFDGPVCLPASVSDIIIAVVGLDDRTRGGPCGDGNPPNVDALTVAQLATLYNFPQTKADGQIIGLQAFGGYAKSDLQKYFGTNKVPSMTDVNLEVDGTLYQNTQTGNGYETTADICIAGSAAPGAAINTYWSSRNELGWQIFLNRVLSPPIGAIEKPPNVVSTSYMISWADDPSYEDPFTGTDFGSSSDPSSIPGVLSQIFQSLAAIGVNVFVASGDSGADSEEQDGAPSSQTHVQYPGSDPYIISVGGTMVGQQNSQPTLSLEYIWSNLYQANITFSGATAGGASQNFPSQFYQTQAGIKTITDSDGKSYSNNRFIPDVSGMVAMKTFYLNGNPYPDFIGTSCVAPLYAGLTALIQSAIGFSPGFLNPLLYELGVSPTPPFNTITEAGDNNSGDSAPYFLGGNGNKIGTTTWDPCTGWGSIDGMGLLNGLAGLLFPQDLYIVADKNTFSLDEVKDQTFWPSAFWVVLQGFTPNATADATITLSGTFYGLSDITLSPLSRILEMPDNQNTPQQIWYPYNVIFQSRSVSDGTFPTSGSVVYTLSASIAIDTLGVTSPSPSQPAEFALLEGDNPYFTNIGLQSDGQLNQYYLSQDLRVFTITPGLIDGTTNQPYPQLGDSSITAKLTTTSPTSYDPTTPFTYITQLLQQLNASNSKYILPVPQGQTDPLDTLLPGQANVYQNFSSTTPSTVDSNGNVHLNYSFAIARVRLFEGPGTTTDTPVRVLFRLFSTLNFDTHYDGTVGTPGSVGSMYSYLPDAAQNPLEPLPGGDGNPIDGTTIDTIPFYATGNFETSPVQHDYDVSGDPSSSTVNSKLITNNTSSEQIYAYYGCYLNVYDPSVTVYNTPIVQLLASVHHCLVAQIACDDSPIPVTQPPVSPQNYDKMAQRNTNINRSDNPGPASGHRIPQTFDTAPTPAYSNPSGPLLNYHAEMMVDWGNTPIGSTAYIYWPQVDASSVVSLAKSLYVSPNLEVADAHTVKCTVGGGFTLVPIPAGTDQNFAGLFTIDLPLGVVQGEQFNITVRRVLYGPSSDRSDKGTSSERAKRRISLVRPRYVTGSFAVTIPVSNPSVLLEPEEQTLSVLKYRLQHWSPTNRWYPVLLRYIAYIAGRVDGFGGNSGLIPASPPGSFPVPKPITTPFPGLPGAKEYTGKVVEITYDRFGEFRGFAIRTESGKEVRFRGREEKVEGLIRFAWEKRALISVEEDGASEWPISVVLRRL